MADKRDYYEVLEVTREATKDVLKKSYRRLAVKFHPDKNPGDATAEEKFKEIGEAYDILMDDDKRAAYDRYGHAAFAPGGRGMGGAGGMGGGMHDPFDIFREVFGAGGGGDFGGGVFEQFFGGGGRGRGARNAGSDLRISLEEAALGCEKEIEITKLDTCKTCTGSGSKTGGAMKTCGTCRGSGQVVNSRGMFQIASTCPACRGYGQIIDNPCPSCGGDGRQEVSSRIKLRIPAGIESGSRLRSPGNGEAGVRGGPSGDLYVVVLIKKHEIFQREGDDLYCEMPVSFPTAALGGEVKVPTLEGHAMVKIPAGTQPETVFRVRGKGIKGLNSSGAGDLFVRAKVEVPTKLNGEQRRKLEEFAALYGEDNQPLHQTFFEKAKRFFDFGEKKD
jgi:molecular chaperone DnaJ